MRSSSNRERSTSASNPNSLVSQNSQSAILPADATRRSSIENGSNCRSLPCSPNVSGRSALGSGSPTSHQAAALEQFLARIEAFQNGSLKELTLLLQEAKALERKALQATTASLEHDAVQKVDFCYERAGRVALIASQHLKELSSEGTAGTAANAAGGSSADLRRQSLAGTSALLQNAVEDLFQAQRAFRGELQAKSQRQLRIAFPDASQEAMVAVASASRSAASTIKESIRQQSGSGPLDTRTALMASPDDLDALQDLADSAKMLQQALTEVELLVMSQGKTISDIALQVAKTRDNTQTGQEQLQQASRVQTRMRKRQMLCCLFILLLLAIGAGIVYYLHH